MFNKITKKDKRTSIEKEIDNVFYIMSTYQPDSIEYTNMALNIETLYKAKSNETIKYIKPDTIAIIAGNLLGILLILGYEKANIVTTKALGFIIKGRV